MVADELAFKLTEGIKNNSGLDPIVSTNREDEIVNAPLNNSIITICFAIRSPAHVNMGRNQRNRGNSHAFGGRHTMPDTTMCRIRYSTPLRPSLFVFIKCKMSEPYGD